MRRGKTCFCVLNRFPYNNGHLLVAPFRHEGPLEALTDEERAEVMSLTTEAKLALDRGIGGPLDSISGYTMKHPPKQFSDTDARQRVEDFIAGKLGH